MGMRMIDPHPVNWEWRNCTKSNAFEEVDIHNAEAACGKEKGEAAEEKCKSWMVKVLFEKVVEVECKADKESDDSEE